MGILLEAMRVAHPNWDNFFAKQRMKMGFQKLDYFVTQEYATNTCYPDKENIFNAFRVDPCNVKVVIVGQDPYHEAGQAMGLAFSVRDGITPPPSLRNIQKELSDDIGGDNTNTDLTCWAGQGVFLINTVLTVRDGQANSHAGHGWEDFTRDAIYYAVRKSGGRSIGILWGKQAQTNAWIFNKGRVIKSAHPSPLSAYRGFFGSKPFSKANQLLVAEKLSPVQWD